MKIPDIIKQAARDLRKNMTPSEKILWDEIRRWKILEKQFQKQKPIFLYEENSWFPRYIIADFVCLDTKLIIELDGSIHDIPEVLLLDKHKEELLQQRWFKIIRFTNEQVMNDISKVLEEIKESLNIPLCPTDISPFMRKERK